MKHTPDPFENTPLGPPSDLFNVLIVDDEPAVRDLLGDMLRGKRVCLHHAASLHEARGIAERGDIDVALIDMVLPDGSGAELASELRLRDPSIQSIVVTGQPGSRQVAEAMRAGACDFLAKPFRLDELNRCVDRALSRRAQSPAFSRRLQKLQGLCHKLNPAELKTSRGPGEVPLTEKFRAILEDELDLEQVLRRTLECVLEQVGATNAVIFLPSSAGAYTVGGYINYSLDKARIDTMLGVLADTAAGRIAESDSPLHVTDNLEMAYRLDDHAGWLTGHHAVGFPCRDRGEVLATLLLLRSRAEPFAAAAINDIASICPILARHLVKVVNIHHRMRDDSALDYGNGTDPDEMQF